MMMKDDLDLPAHLSHFTAQCDAVAQATIDRIEVLEKDIAGLEHALDSMEAQRDAALDEAEGYEALADAVHSFFDLLESPSPCYNERAVEVLRDCARRLQIIC